MRFEGIRSSSGMASSTSGAERERIPAGRPLGQTEKRNGSSRWLEEATDARILAIPRLFGLLYGPIEDRLPLGDAWRAAMRRKFPDTWDGSTPSEGPPTSFA